MIKILKVISNILLTLVIIILLAYFVLKITNILGIYRVMTGSMEKGIHPGDYLVVKKEKSYKKGDIVTYKIDDNYITHRIVKIENGRVITKGDANNVEDEEFSSDNIIGKYIYKSEILNFIMDYKYILVAIILILFIVFDYINKGDKKVNNKKEEIEVL
jgi:signal peptidase